MSENATLGILDTAITAVEDLTILGAWVGEDMRSAVEHIRRAVEAGDDAICCQQIGDMRSALAAMHESLGRALEAVRRDASTGDDSINRPPYRLIEAVLGTAMQVGELAELLVASGLPQNNGSDLGGPS